MNLRLLIAAASGAALTLGLASGALAAQATANGDVAAKISASIVGAVTVTKASDMAFGQITLPTTGTSTITLAATDTSGTTNTAGATVTSNGTAQPVANAASPPKAAVFTVNGPGGMTFTPSHTACDATGNAQGVSSICALNFSINPYTSETGTTAIPGTAATNGNYYLKYGATFDLVAGTTTAGTYGGSFTVSVNYP